MKDIVDPAKRADELPFVKNLQKVNAYSMASDQQINIKLVENKRTLFVRTWVTKLFGYRNEKARILLLHFINWYVMQRNALPSERFVLFTCR